jgi:hypothetical protein
MRVVALTPGGDVVRFGLHAVDGYQDVTSALRYFVSASHVYILASANKIDPMNPGKTLGHFDLIEVFDLKGVLTQSIVLEPGLHPVNFGRVRIGRHHHFFCGYIQSQHAPRST